MSTTSAHSQLCKIQDRPLRLRAQTQAPPTRAARIASALGRGVRSLRSLPARARRSSKARKAKRLCDEKQSHNQRTRSATAATLAPILLLALLLTGFARWRPGVTTVADREFGWQPEQDNLPPITDGQPFQPWISPQRRIPSYALILAGYLLIIPLHAQALAWMEK